MKNADGKELNIMEINLTCIVCPMGCSLKVKTENGEVKDVRGNSCPRGAAYARTEVTAPVRTLTTTVRAGDKMVSVKSSKPLPKEKISEYMKIINSVNINKSVSIGDVIVENIGGTGIDIVATKNAEL